MVIAIDGPAGAGKSTVAKRLAKELELHYLDTGALYRCVALQAELAGLGPDDGLAAAELCKSDTIEFGPGDPQEVYLNGRDVSREIRTPHIGEMASALSVHPAVRALLADQQKQMVARGHLTLEGRDVTTVIAPDAALKIYMTASVDERTKRRHLELQERGLPVDIADLRKQIVERDARDMNRTDAPLTIAPDAVVLDTDGMSIDDVVNAVKNLAQSI